MHRKIIGGPTALIIGIMLYGMFTMSANYAAYANDTAVSEYNRSITTSLEETKKNVTQNLTGHTAFLGGVYENVIDTAIHTGQYGIEFGGQRPGLAKINSVVGPVVVMAGMLAFAYTRINAAA